MMSSKSKDTAAGMQVLFDSMTMVTQRQPGTQPRHNTERSPKRNIAASSRKDRAACCRAQLKAVNPDLELKHDDAPRHESGSQHGKVAVCSRKQCASFRTAWKWLRRRWDWNVESQHLSTTQTKKSRVSRLRHRLLHFHELEPFPMRAWGICRVHLTTVFTAEVQLWSASQTLYNNRTNCRTLVRCLLYSCRAVHGLHLV